MKEDIKLDSGDGDTMGVRKTGRVMSGFSLFLVALGLFLLGTTIVLLMQGSLIQSGMSVRNYTLLTSSLQNIFMFILPAWLTIYLSGRRTMGFTGLDRSPRVQGYLVIFVLMVIGIPFLNQIIYWNSEMHFPTSLHDLEVQFREWEDSAGEVTQQLLNTKSFGGMIVGVLIIGLLTGFAEEIFFRGMIQKMIGDSLNSPHLAIWIAALIFSAVHFQFFGFFPRLLLGAFFGYLFYWSGSLWTAVFAHALNNSSVVFFSWLSEVGILDIDSERIGVSSAGVPWIACISMFIFFAGLYFIRCHFFPGIGARLKRRDYNGRD